MIAVTFALPSESQDFRRLLGADQHQIAILHTGVGERETRARLGPFLDGQRFDLLLSSGFAGGAEPSLGVGDLFLARNFSDPALLAHAQELLIARTGTLATADRVIETTAERAAFAHTQGAEAVDMETAAIAAACVERSLPLLSLRVISDTARAPFPAPPHVLFDLARQKTEPLTLIKYLARHPAGIVRLMRFARQIAVARAGLTSALAVIVREADFRPLQ